MINNEFKKSVDRQAMEMLTKDPELFVTGKLTASERQVLFTKQTGQILGQNIAIKLV